MSIPFLKTKLYIPELRREFVSRPRLVERFKQAIERKLTLVSAPAGYGKTTLVCQSLKDNGIPVSWVSLDKEDNDPSRFWFYCIKALSVLDNDFGSSALDLILSSQSLNLKAIIPLVINEVSESNKDIVLVLDDFHLVENESVCESLSFLINNLPPKMHVVITSRIDPPLSLSRLRVQGELSEFRASDLRFDKEETTLLFNKSMGFNLTAEEIEILDGATEGWIAGLQLAAFSLQRKKNTSEFIKVFSANNRYILDYLTEEVLNNLDEETQSFLLDTSILDRFAASLCNAVTESDGGQVMIDRLDKLNLFIEPLDGKGEWYRYHHLFAELLRSYLVRSKQKSSVFLHLRASEWFEQQGLITEAIEHALEAKYYPRAIRLIDSFALSTIVQSYGSTVLSWLERIPKEITDSQPWLCFYSALANQLIGNIDEVDEFIQCAEDSVCQAEESGQTPECCPDTAKVRGYINTIRITKAVFQGDYETAIELGKQSLGYLSESDGVARAGVLINVGSAFRYKGLFQEAIEYLCKAISVGKQSGHVYAEIVASYYLADIETEMGQLKIAEDLCLNVIERGKSLGTTQPLPATGFPLIGLSKVQYHKGEIDKAIDSAVEGVALCEQSGNWSGLISGKLSLAWLYYIRGDKRVAESILRSIAEISAGRLSVSAKKLIESWQTRFSLYTGDVAGAEHDIDDQRLRLDDVPDYQNENIFLNQVRISIAKGEILGNILVLKNLITKVQAEKRIKSAIEMLILLSETLEIAEDKEAALSTLEKALSLAEPEGFVQVFINEGAQLIGLLRQVQARGSAKGFIGKIISIYEEQKPKLPLSSDKSESTLNAFQNMPEPLSKREIEVLGLIVSGMSNREIAKNLILGESTVKTHINNIYGKMNVNSRTQAVAKSRELNLF